MNRPVMEGLRLNVPAYVKHARLVEWVAERMPAALVERVATLLQAPLERRVE